MKGAIAIPNGTSSWETLGAAEPRSLSDADCRLIALETPESDGEFCFSSASCETTFNADHWILPMIGAVILTSGRKKLMTPTERIAREIDFRNLPNGSIMSPFESRLSLQPMLSRPFQS